MRATTRAIGWAALAIGGACLLGASPAGAQMAMSGGRRPLGGYGAGTISSYYGTGGGYIPYNGRGAGILPTGAGGMGASPAPRMIPRTPIGGASSGGMGMGSGAGRRAYAPLLPGGGMGMGGGMGPRRSPAGPGLGYPFQLPMQFGGGSGSMGMP